MAFEWITGNAPQFWKNYIALFESDNKAKQRRYVVFDIETIIEKDDSNIKGIGGVGITDNALSASDYFEVYIAGNNDDATIDDKDKVVEAEAIIRFLDYVKDATLVSHKIEADIEILNQALKKLNLGRLKNTYMDTVALYSRWKNFNNSDNNISLNELAGILNISTVGRLSTVYNAYTTALIFLKLKNKLKI